MNRNVVLLAIIFLVFPFLVYSATFIMQETEKISLVPNAIDPDNDTLTIHYSPPLNEIGEWQTTYGDAGNYQSAITVSDGYTNATEEVLIVVKKKEESPVIESYEPQQLLLTIDETLSIDFHIEASDLNKDLLSYEWYLDNKKVKEGQKFSYYPNYDDEGNHKVLVIVSDGISSANKEWEVQVFDFDIENFLESIPDETVNENELVSLKLPDFEKYGLTYSVSSPVGNQNEWHTTYDDAGTHDVNVHVEGKGFSDDEIVEIKVNNVDRLLVFDSIENQVIRENQTLTISLKAMDPDGDEIEYSAGKLPEGAKLEGNIFSWTPDFDTVKKEDFIDYAIEKFTVLSKTFYAQFIGSSNNKSVVYNLIITVKDVNRAPIIEDMEPINIKESESFKIMPKVYDLDLDRVSIKYSGLTNTNSYTSDFDDAGTHFVTVTASDGSLETSMSVQVNIENSNRPPVFRKIEPVKAQENDNIAILLNAYDPDGDSITFSLENPPEDYSIKDNSFFWTPSFSTAKNQETKSFDFVFVASDGKAISKQIAKVNIADMNRAPRIINATDSIVGKVNEPVLMFVKAVDDDGDALTYTWDFGILDSYKATEAHQRTFTSPGAKSVKVIVSDGIDPVEKIINVYIADSQAIIPAPRSDVTTRIEVKNIDTTSRVVVEGDKTVLVLVEKDGKTQFKEITGSAITAANKPPRIVDLSNNIVARVNEPVLLFVKAIDDDGDALTYTWDFGLFDKHQGTQYHQRKFTSFGTKEVEVTVSDGKNAIKQLIIVNVV